MNMSRITFKTIKKWFENETMFTVDLRAYNGYYHLTIHHGYYEIHGETPREIWEKYTAFKRGYMFHEMDNDISRTGLK